MPPMKTFGSACLADCAERWLPVTPASRTDNVWHWMPPASAIVAPMRFPCGTYVDAPLFGKHDFEPRIGGIRVRYCRESGLLMQPLLAARWSGRPPTAGASVRRVRRAHAGCAQDTTGEAPTPSEIRGIHCRYKPLAPQAWYNIKGEGTTRRQPNELRTPRKINPYQPGVLQIDIYWPCIRGTTRPSTGVFATRSGDWPVLRGRCHARPPEPAGDFSVARARRAPGRSGPP